MSIHHSNAIDSGRNQGIALIIVLGFLAVLTLMAVAFTIQMRTERMASKVYMDSVQARHLVDVGLARAMDDLDQELISNDLVAPDSDLVDPNSDFPYFESRGTAGTNINLYSGEVSRYVPRVPSLGGAIPLSQYVNIPNPRGSGDPIGRYAYLAVNMTGLLDVNEVGKPNPVTRNTGKSPGEIRITPERNPEVSGFWTSFSSDLGNKWRRMENLNEFITITGANLTSTPSSVGIFSRSLVERNPLGEPKIVITDAASISTADARTNVMAKLQLSGLNAIESGVVLTNMIDFLDSDRIPQALGLDAYCGEPVPMINEVIVSNFVTKTLSVSGSATQILYTHDVFVEFEVWNPFSQSASFRFDYDPSNITFPLVSPAGLTPQPVHLTRTPNIGASIPISADDFALISYRYTVGPTNVGGNAVGVRIALGGTARILLDQEAGAPVNKVDFGALGIGANDLQVAVTGINGAPFDQPISVAASKRAIDVDDPRMNYLTPMASRTGDPGWFAVGVSVSPRAINPRALSSADNSGEGNLTALPAMHVRNTAFTADAPGELAELGYVGIGKSWRTIALYDHPTPGKFKLNPILDYFTTVPSDTPRKGMVSLNPVNTNSLASVFVDVPLNARPGTPAGPRVSKEQALTMASEIHKNVGTISSMSILGTFPDLLANQPTDDLREAVIRNSAGLLTVRQNLFAIIVEAQTLGERPSPSAPQIVTANSRALAFAWRDPLPGTNSVGQFYIRQFIYLEN